MKIRIFVLLLIALGIAAAPLQAWEPPTAEARAQLLALCRPQIETFMRISLDYYKWEEAAWRSPDPKISEQVRASNEAIYHDFVQDAQTNGANAQDVKRVWDRVDWLDGLDTPEKVYAAMAVARAPAVHGMTPVARAEPPVGLCLLRARLAELKAEPRARADQKTVLPILAKAKGFARSGDLDHALVEYTRAMLVSPLNPAYYVERGRLYNRKKQYPHAITDLTWALRLDPQAPGAALERAVAFGASGLPVRALADFNRALKTDPYHMPAFFNRGLLYFHLHHYRRGLGDLGASILYLPGYLIGLLTGGIS